MTLQQLKYIITIAECGSITSAAGKLLVAQPSLSKSVSELEKEMGITIFYRNNRGVYLSEDGSKFLSYARQVMEQAELLEQQYKQKDTVRRVFAVSSQHYAFVVNAFVALVKEYGKNKYVWRDNVENFILLKSNEEYFTDPVCKNGYFRGIETYNFVRDITARFEQYKKKIKS